MNINMIMNMNMKIWDMVCGYGYEYECKYYVCHE